MTVRRTAQVRLGFVRHREQTLEEFLLELGLGDFNLDRLVNLLVVATLVVGIVLDGGGEQGVDERGLSKSGFSSNLPG